ncbi:hypothetical protein Tco_1240069 [Tanacetum coccineum]
MKFSFSALMDIQEEVIFNIHMQGKFKFGPLSQSKIYGQLLFCIPQQSLENGSKLIHSDVDRDTMYDMVRGSLKELVPCSERKTLACCLLNSTPPFNSSYYVVNNVVNNLVNNLVNNVVYNVVYNMVKNEVKNKGVSRKVVQKGKKMKSLDKGKGVMIEYDSVLANKRKHVSRGSGIVIQDIEDMNLDEVSEHVESEKEIEECV